MGLSSAPDLHTTIPHIPNPKSILSYAWCVDFHPRRFVLWRETLLKDES